MANLKYHRGLYCLPWCKLSGETNFRFKFMGKGRASALKVYSHTYKCQSIFSNIVVLYIKRSAWNQWWTSKNPFCKILKNAEVRAKKPWKIPLSAILPFFDSFLAITSVIFNILLNGFLLVHQWFQALLLMYNTTICKKNDFLTFICVRVNF